MREKFLEHDNFVIREGLNEDRELVNLVHNWFNELVRLYNEEIQKGTLVLHRALIVGIIGHPNTKEIFPSKAPVKLKRKSYIIKGNNGRDYYIILHSDDAVPGGYMSDRHVRTLGDDDFQKQGRDLLQKVRKTGFLNFIKKSRLSDEKTKVRVSKILGNMDEISVQDISQELTSLQT